MYTNITTTEVKNIIKEVDKEEILNLPDVMLEQNYTT
jgi:hypothetical protein